MTLPSPDSILLQSLPHATDKNIIDGSGGIASKFQLSQPHIDTIKYSLLRLLKGFPVEPRVLEDILKLIFIHKTHIARLLSNKTCINHDRKKAKMIINEVVSRIQAVLCLDPVGDIFAESRQRHSKESGSMVSGPTSDELWGERLSVDTERGQDDRIWGYPVSE